MPAKKDAANGSGKMTKEEEKLLLENSRQVTGTTSALFYGNAFIVSALPICEYCTASFYMYVMIVLLNLECYLVSQGSTGVYKSWTHSRMEFSLWRSHY